MLSDLTSCASGVRMLDKRLRIKMQNKQYDICVVGSGAGAGPVIYELSKAGFKVLVLEKGPWLKTGDFSKDEITATKEKKKKNNRSYQTPVNSTN